MSIRSIQLVFALLATALVLGCSEPDKAAATDDQESAVVGAASPESDAPTVEQLWADFCHYVAIASPDLAAAYGQRLLDQAAADQLGGLLARDDEATRRAVRLLDETQLTAGHPELGEVWQRIRARARPARAGDG
jgi:hypothetical protein